ncbi:heavy metal translocating P-type ATPase [Vibrio sp. 10N.222.51.C12]|uniref:heavy metal translocating P-type ATPase n=2 Tax=Vibrio TaxID=662 RepID=UPI001F530054
MMHHYVLNLSGLSCSRCVNKLEAALNESLNDIIIHSITTTQLEVSSTSPLAAIYPIISQLGYTASETLHFSLTGLSCGKCVAKLTQQLEQYDELSIIHLDKLSLIVSRSNPNINIADIVTHAGYKATPHTDDTLRDHGDLQADLASTIESKQSHDRALTSPAPQINTQDHTTIENDRSVQLLIQGMTCASCVSSVEQALKQVDGVTHASVNLAEQSAMISIKNDKDAAALLIPAIEEAGYQAEIVIDLSSSQATQQQRLIDHQRHQKKNTIIALSLGAPLMLWGVLGGNMIIRNPQDQVVWGVIGLACLWLLATVGRDFFVNAAKALKHKRATMDTLVALGTGAAWFYSTLVVIKPDWFPIQSRHVYFEASAMIIGLISLGHFIEAKAKSRTNQSLQALMTLQPQHAVAIIDGKDTVLSIAEITLGMTLRIKPGEKIPVDAYVTQGESYIDESMLTGEPIAISKQQGDTVSAGTLNRNGSLVVVTTGVGADTKLSRIITMVRQAQSSKPAIAKLADSISAVFVPVVVVIALASAMLWFFFGPEPQASYMLVVATTVLIIACPCALGLATPLSITVGVGKAAQAGILIKDADALQKLSKVKAVVFDKTGTLTIGKPTVQRVFLFGLSEPELATLVVPLEHRSEHPLAKAVTQYWERIDTAVDVERFENIQGKGVSGDILGKSVLIASLNHIQSIGIETSSIKPALKHSRRLASTPVIVVVNGQIQAVIAIADEIKPEAKQAIDALTANGIHTVMLTGDNQHVANTVAEQIGVAQTIAEVLPDEKANHIKQLKAQYGSVAMVGDGINDAPALAVADVGIAMGSGSDVAIESASMTLLNSNPNAINYAIELSRATVKNIKQNLFGAFVYNSLGIPIAAGALYPLFGFLLSPVFAGAAMALSSITVVTNANRLRRFKSKH